MLAIGVAVLSHPATQTGPSVTVNSAAVDLQNNDQAGQKNYKAFLDVTSIAGTTPNFAAKIQESDSTTSTTFTDISGAAFTTVTTATGNAGPESIYFRTNKRYVRLVSVTDAASTQAVLAAYLVSDLRVA